MMDPEIIEITPITQPLNASVILPGSKSLTNRVLIIAALAQGSTTIKNALFSDDTRYMISALQALGFKIMFEKEKAVIHVDGLGGKIPSHSADLFIGNAGTAARFLTAFLTLGNGKFTLDGNVRMRERPIEGLVNALIQLGADISPSSSSKDLKHLPIEIKAAGLKGGKAEIPGDISSQFLSALLISAPYAKNPVKIRITTGLNSKPYVDLTLSVMADFGVNQKNNTDLPHSITIDPAIYQSAGEYGIETDASSASYFFAAAAICGGKMTVKNIRWNSKQGDIAFVSVLEKMGCTISETEDSISIENGKRPNGIDINMKDIPDTAQTLSAIAPFALSPTRIRGIASARLKETDRISATCKELRKLGVPVDEHDDGMTIYPTKEFHECVIQTYDDHRMAMAFSLIGLKVPGVKIENPDCVSKTFPNFFEVLDSLR